MVITNAIAVSGAMLIQSIWEQLDDFFGPILQLIFGPIIEALQDVAFRRTLLSTIIWSVIIVGGLLFVVYEGPVLINMILESTKTTLPRTTVQRSTTRTRPQTDTSRLHKISADKSKKEGEERESRVQASGVRVTAKMKKTREIVHLYVTVHNGSDTQIDMVVADINLPAGIDTAIGSFRMQRYGSISPGQSETRDFLLNVRGGDPNEIGGYVEFLGASYEVSKIPLPAIEVVS